MSSVHSVGTTVVRAFEDSAIPDSNKKAIIKAILGNEGSLADVLLQTHMDSIYLKFERMYRYAKDNYYYGLPNGAVFTDSITSTQVKTIIENQIGKSITIDYFNLVPLNHVHNAWDILSNTYGYADEESNIIPVLTSQIGFDVTLHHIIPIFSEDLLSVNSLRLFQVWGISSYVLKTPIRIPSSRPGRVPGTELDYIVAHEESSTNENGVAIEYLYVDGDGDLQDGRLDFDLYDADIDALYYQVKYYYEETSQIKVGYWTYKHGEGTHPTLDLPRVPSYSAEGTFFPFVFIRDNKVNKTDPSFHSTEAYLTTKAMLNIIGVDYQELGDNIHQADDGQGNTNTDINKVEQAVLLMAVPINSTNVIERKYLFDFFNKLYAQTLDSGYVPPVQTIYVDKAQEYIVSDAGFKIKYSFHEITKKLRVGSVAEVGEVVSSSGSVVMKKQFFRRHPKTQILISVIKEVPVPYWIFKKQITDVTHQEIRILNPFMYYDIWKDLGYLAEATADELLILVDYDIVKDYSGADKEQLYLRAMHYIFNARETQKLAWYETGLFRFFVIAVAIIITIKSLGTSSPITGTLITASVTTIAIYVLETIIVSLVLGKVARVVVKEFGLENSLLAAILLVALAVYGQFNVPILPMASKDLLFLAMNLVSGVQSVTQGLMQDIAKEMSLLGEEMDNAWREIDEAKKLLETSNLIDPYEIVGMVPRFIASETPETFFNRTIHTGNIGTLVFDEIENYVELSLTLPSIDQTLGDDLNAY